MNGKQKCDTEPARRPLIVILSRSSPVDDTKRLVGEAARSKFPFLRNPLERFADALNSVQKIDAVGWEQLDNLGFPRRRPEAQPPWAKLDRLSNSKFVARH